MWINNWVIKLALTRLQDRNCLWFEVADLMSLHLFGSVSLVCGPSCVRMKMLDPRIDSGAWIQFTIMEQPKHASP
jgi:hypothetical protein